MERHSVVSLISVALLIVLAWLGIVLFAKQGGDGRVVLIVIWAVVLAAVATTAIWNLVQARRARLERRSEVAGQPK